MNDLFRSIEAKHIHDNYFGAATGAAEVAKIVAPKLPVDESNGCPDGPVASEADCGAGCWFCVPVTEEGRTQCLDDFWASKLQDWQYACTLSASS